MAETIGEKIRARRRARNLNQTELAQLLGIEQYGQQVVSTWERGLHRPATAYMLRLIACEILTLDDLKEMEWRND